MHFFLPCPSIFLLLCFISKGLLHLSFIPSTSSHRLDSVCLDPNCNYCTSNEPRLPCGHRAASCTFVQVFGCDTGGRQWKGGNISSQTGMDVTTMWSLSLSLTLAGPCLPVLLAFLTQTKCNPKHPFYLWVWVLWCWGFGSGHTDTCSRVNAHNLLYLQRTTRERCASPSEHMSMMLANSGLSRQHNPDL